MAAQQMQSRPQKSAELPTHSGQRGSSLPAARASCAASPGCQGGNSPLCCAAWRIPAALLRFRAGFRAGNSQLTRRVAPCWHAGRFTASFGLSMWAAAGQAPPPAAWGHLGTAVQCLHARPAGGLGYATASSQTSAHALPCPQGCVCPCLVTLRHCSS